MRVGYFTLCALLAMALVNGPSTAFAQRALERQCLTQGDPGLIEACSKLIEGGRLDPTVFATHRFSLNETEEAYDVFGAAAETHALKVVLSAVPVEHRAAAEKEELVGV